MADAFLYELRHYFGRLKFSFKGFNQFCKRAGFYSEIGLFLAPQLAHN